MPETQTALYLTAKCTLRHWKTSWASYLLLLLIVAVGVGAFNGIRQASRAASANFGLFNEAVSGRSDFLLEAPSGRIPEASLAGLSSLDGQPDWHLVPVVEGSIAQIDSAGEPIRQLRLVGLDLIGLGNLPTFNEQGLSFADEDSQWHERIGRGSGVWLSHTLARKAGLTPGDRLDFVAGGRVASVEIAGVLGTTAQEMPDDLLVGDLPAVQVMLQREGFVDRVEVLLTARASRTDRALLARIEQRLSAGMPPDLRLRPAAERAEERASMTEAFRLNLLILSLIAILVGAYLILQALDAAVVRRRNETATLRSLGVSARVLFTLCLAEAFLIGLIGSIAGIGVGYLLASGAVHLLADTVNTLYFATSADAIRLTSDDWWLGLTLGVAFSLLAGLLPARDAMVTPPAQILSRGDWSPGFVWLRRPTLGLALLATGLLCLLIPPPTMAGGSKMAIGGFLAAGAWILGAALLSGQSLVGLAKLLRPLAKGPVWRIAISRLGDGSSRHRLAVAGLVVAVGMVTGMLQMVGSFRGTIEEWFDVRFQADLYVSERGGSGAGSILGIDPAIMARLEATPEVEFADTLYLQTVAAPVGSTQLAGIDFEAWQNRIGQIWLKPPGSLPQVAGAEPALVSEAFGRRFNVLHGGSVTVETPTGPRVVSPIGIFSDYGNEFGTAAIDAFVWRQWTKSERPINTSLHLIEGTATNDLRDRLRLEFPGLDVRNAHELRTLALGIFDQTFKVTSALNGIGLTVALVGLLLGLFAIFEESARSWQTLGYLGFPRRALVLTAGIEGAGIALAAWLSGTILGLVLGWLLIAVINVQSFGWTLLWQVPVGAFLAFGSVLTLVGFLCGVVSGTWWFRNR